MKLRTFIVLIVSCVAISATHAQNCCEMQVGPLQVTGGNGSVPPSSSGPGGVYIATQTHTYPINCVNTQNGKPCSSATIPSNVVTATGAAANYNNTFVACNPTFETTPTIGTSGGTIAGTSTTQASFKDQGTGYTGVNSSNGQCVPQNPQPFAISNCQIITCQTSGGGGGCCPCLNPPPQTKLQSLPGLLTVTAGKYMPVQCSVACCNSPVLIDVSGHGFSLTSAASGVMFNMSGSGPIQLAWTAPGADNAFLALPGPDGLVHTGKELFGNFTPQPASTTPNGFAALAVYDLPANGGNGDGIIDARDAVFNSLRLWIDANHDGISQPEELYTLPSLGVNSISLNYQADMRTDQYGNLFRYRAIVNPNHPDSVGRVAYDVFFSTLTQPGSAVLTATCAAPANKETVSTNQK